MDEKRQNAVTPVPLEAHYRIFKDAEQRIHRLLENDAHENLMIGFRVAYDERDSPNEPGVLPFKVEGGYTGMIDLLIGCVHDRETVEVMEEEEEGTPEGWDFPLTPAEMTRIFKSVREELQAAAGMDLNVGTFYVFTGSPTQAGGIHCGCNGNTKKAKRLTTNTTTGKQTRSCVPACG